MNFLKNLQNKPQQWKKRFALTFTGVIVFIIFVFWVGAILPKHLEEASRKANGTTTSVIQDINQPLASFGSTLGRYIGELKDIFKRASTTASTTSSSTDLVQ